MTPLAPLAVSVPLVVAALILALHRLLPRRATDLLALLTAASVAAMCARLLMLAWTRPLVYWFGGWRPAGGFALGISFAIDPTGAGLATLAAFLVTCALLFAWHYFEDAQALFQVLMLVFLSAMAGFCLTGDLFNLFVFFELMSVAAYALTGYKIEEEQSLEGAFNFATTNSIGAFLVLIGLGLLYSRTSALNMAQIGRALAHGPADGLVVVAFAAIAAGFMVKAAIVPFHFWLSDAHAVAPAPVCVLFSGVMVELGLYAVARVTATIFSGPFASHAAAVHDLLIALGVTTALIGAILCWPQRHLKRMLAYSTISHNGIILAGLGWMSQRGMAGASLYAVGHGLVKAALFLEAGILLHWFGSLDEGVLHGKGRAFVTRGALFFVAALALAGMPPFLSWRGKSLIESASEHKGAAWIEAALIFASAITAGAILRAGVKIFFGWGEPSRQKGQTPRTEARETGQDYKLAPMVMTIPVILLLVCALGGGLLGRLEPAAHRASARFLDRRQVAAIVLDGNRTWSDPRLDKPDPELPGILAGVAAAALAAIIALGAVFPDRLPRSFMAAGQATGKLLLDPLRKLHSGNVCDYAAWLAAGVALIGACLAACLR